MSGSKTVFWKHVTDEELARSCGYIKDDRYLASLYGVPVDYVRRMRKKVEVKEAAATRRLNSAENKKPAVYSSDNYERSSREAAVQGSADLLRAIARHHPERLQLGVAKPVKLV